MKKDIREINVFRVWVNALVEGIVQEYPTFVHILKLKKVWYI